ncbi:MAG: T9SS type A sorting domain-containing protein [Bacteroidetes bacterium]|nr:T9SS type A sorting domain-containing protein [Bacteroidota bacterium]
MKTKIFTTLTALLLLFSASGQQADIELAMTALDNEAHIALDSIKVMNRTQGGDTLLVWPDTLLYLIHMDVSELENIDNLFRVLPNYPNPVVGETKISVYVPDKDNVVLTITDVSGRLVLKSDRVLSKGLHTFRFQPADAYLYFFTTQWRGNTQSIKILQGDTHNNGACVLDYMGSESSSLQLKHTNGIQAFKFNQGDELLLIGYTTDLQSGMLEKPYTSDTCTFQFATNIPCPGTPTVDYEGQIYNTIQVFGQCWLKENLNVGTMIQGSQSMTDNLIIEKYCYNNDPENCITYGGQYQWNEMMQYSTEEGIQGICPLGWHIPGVEEWRVLFGAVDSQYGIGATEWYLPSTGFQGFDAGTNLKTISGWIENGNGTDLFGFSGLPGGYRHTNGSFNSVGEAGNLYTSHEINFYDVAHLFLSYELSGLGLSDFMPKTYGLSVRCLRDE